MSLPNQQSVHALSGAYAVDAVDDEERVAFERHLAQCADCADEVASLREAAALLSIDAVVAPPPSLRAAILSAAAQSRPLPPLSEPVRPAPEPEPVGAGGGATVLPFRRRLASAVTRSRVAVAASAAAVVAVVGVGVAQPWQPDDTVGTSYAAQVLDAPDAVAVTQGFPDGSSATLTRSLRENRAVIQTRQMADPPGDGVFELWLVDDLGRATPAGLMANGGDRTRVLEGDAADASRVAITVEPEGGSAQPTSEPIAIFDLEDA